MSRKPHANLDANPRNSANPQNSAAPRNSAKPRNSAEQEGVSPQGRTASQRDAANRRRISPPPPAAPRNSANPQNSAEPPHPAATARQLAFEVLLKCERSEQYSNLALESALSRSRLVGADRALATRLVYGVTEKRLTLDAVIDSLPMTREPEPVVRTVLRMGLYQLLFLDRIPDHAAVDESVRLCPRRASGFVNALLRGFVRDGKRIPLPDRETDPVGYLSVRYSVPSPLLERFLAAFGTERTEALLDGFSAEPPLTLRVNTLRTDRDALLRRFAQAGIDAQPCRYAPTGIRLTGAVGSPRELPGFEESVFEESVFEESIFEESDSGQGISGQTDSGQAGVKETDFKEAGINQAGIGKSGSGGGLFFVQDEASQLCVLALGLDGDTADGKTVIDTCACPGSKSFGAAMCLGGSGQVYAFDLHASKLSLIRTGAARLGLENLTVAARDAREPDPALAGCADAVLCDVPCSGYGVLAKKPELRYKHPDECLPLPDIQLAILSASADYVRPGGVLVYSTCTLLPEENQDNVARFLRTHPAFVPEPFSAGGLDVPTGMVTLAPDTHGTDGFFIAKLRRRS